MYISNDSRNDNRVMVTLPGGGGGDKKGAQTVALTRLGHLHVGIVDPDVKTAQLVRKALSSIGVTQTSVARFSSEVPEMITGKAIDLLVLEWESRPENGIELTRALRAPGSPHRTLPIIITTSRTATEDLATARDAGVNEIVIKPFNTRVMLERITSIIDNPRSFIIAKGYVGPDRRRETKPAPGMDERRRQRQQPMIIEKSDVGEIFVDEEPRMVLPDYELKLKIETSAAKLAGLDNIIPKDMLQQQKKDEQLQWLLSDMQSIRTSYKSMVQEPQQQAAHIDTLSRCCLSIRSRAIPVGYILAARVATALHDFLHKYYIQGNVHHLLIIGKHVETMSAIFNYRIVGDENALARELIENLQTLVRKAIQDLLPPEEKAQ